MEYFDVYRHPIRGYQAVKQGFAWPAFFFGLIGAFPIWAFVKKLWGLGFALLGIYFAVFIAAAIVDELFAAEAVEEGAVGVLLTFLGYTTVWIVVGVKGNDWRRRNLLQRGFEKLDTINAVNPDAAIAISFKRRRDGNTVELGHVEP